MSKSLVYVDKELIIGLAAPYLGSEMHAVKELSVSGGFNWLLQAEVSKTQSQSVIVNIRDMRSDAIANKLLEKVPSSIKFSDVDKCTKYIKDCESEDNIGKLVVVNGVLNIPDKNGVTFNPLSPSPTENIKSFKFREYECFACELTCDGVKFPVYFKKDAYDLLCYCSSKSVEIIGSLEWVPFYEVGKDRTINTILFGAAIWVK